jgi:hypothetical protein
MLLTFERDDAATVLRDAERDIDALLIEDLLFAPEVAEWLLGRVLKPGGEIDRLSARQIRRPARADDGLDIAVDVTCGGKPVAVRIANRLLPRPRLARAAAEACETDNAFGILLRPECASSRCTEIDPHFDAVLTHDMLAQLLKARAATEGGEIAQRLQYRAVRIEAALDAAARAMRTAPLNAAEDFIRGYLALMPAIDVDLPVHPHLLDTRCDPRNPMVVFAPEVLPNWPFLPQMRLAHHLREGVVSLAFGGWGAFFNEMVQVMDPALTRTPFHLALGSGEHEPPALMIIDETAHLSLTRPPEDQEASIRAAVLAADRLRRWFAGQRAAARYWAEIAGEGRGEDRHSRVRHDVTLG